VKYLLIILLTACASFQPLIYIDPEIAPYFTRFEEYYGRPVLGVSARFSPSIAPQAGACIRKRQNGRLVQRTIKIHPDVWRWNGDMAKEQLVFHELGHCELKRSHRNGSISLGKDVGPASIMADEMFGGDNVYEDNHAYYIQELFNGL